MHEGLTSHGCFKSERYSGNRAAYMMFDTF